MMLMIRAVQMWLTMCAQAGETIMRASTLFRTSAFLCPSFHYNAVFVCEGIDSWTSNFHSFMRQFFPGQPAPRNK
jgi:hypothetical protein